jgi:hypothetical protein
VRHARRADERKRTSLLQADGPELWLNTDAALLLSINPRQGRAAAPATFAWMDEPRLHLCFCRDPH